MDAQRIYGEIKKDMRHYEWQLRQHDEYIPKEYVKGKWTALQKIEEYLIKNFDILVEGECEDG